MVHLNLPDYRLVTVESLVMEEQHRMVRLIGMVPVALIVAGNKPREENLILGDIHCKMELIMDW